jgi:hypothetical protein
MIKHLWFAAIFAFSAGAAAPTIAQEVNEGWRVTVTPYLWVSAVDTKVTDPSSGQSVKSSASFGDLLDDLSFAFIGKGEVQYQRTGVLADIVYLKLETKHTLDRPLLPPIEAKADLATTIFTTAAFYRLVETDQLNFDLLGGLRYVKAELDLDFQGVRAGLGRDASRSGTKAIVGVRATQRIGTRSSLTGYGDFGGFGGSTTTWQLYATYNYQWTEKLMASAGYRYLAIDIDRNVSTDIDISGPLLALTYRF